MRSYSIIFSALLVILIVFEACRNSETTNTESVNELEESKDLKSLLIPFADNNGAYPPDSIYDGPFFVANYDYPTSVPKESYPWEKVLNGQPLTKENAVEYIMAVRDYIYLDMALMFNEPKEWLLSENKKSWYNMGWSAQNYDTDGWGIKWEGLEPVYGTMTGQVIKDDIFTDYGFEGPMQNHALVYYNNVAAVTLNNLWKSKDPSGFFPNYTTEAAQFEENAIVIKAAGTTANEEQWPVLKGSGTFDIYRELAYGPDTSLGNIIQELTWIQFDIIIKDWTASPETGWVFSTFIYDASSDGPTPFDRMTLLGVVWGNDPGKMKGDEVLEQTYLNPNAPSFADVTMGYGGRLSGPIDVALVGGTKADGTKDKVFVLDPNGGTEGGNTYLHYTASACMSCHGTATWPPQNDFYPSPDPTHELVFSDTLYNPASDGWSAFYQNRPGDVMMPNPNGYSKSTMALDFDLFMQFALSNSKLGQKNLPEGLAIPEGYTMLDTDNYVHKNRPSK